MTCISTRKTAAVGRIIFMSLGVLLLLPNESNAAPYAGQCDDLLVAVGQKIENANFLGNKAETDRSNLLVKLAEAQAKVNLEKYNDAITKLGNISDTSTALANAPKPKLEDASAINDAVASAIGCVGALP